MANRVLVLMLMVACVDESQPSGLPQLPQFEPAPDAQEPDAPTCPALSYGVVLCKDHPLAECHAPVTETGFGLDCPLGDTWRNAPCYCIAHVDGYSGWCMP